MLSKGQQKRKSRGATARGGPLVLRADRFARCKSSPTRSARGSTLGGSLLTESALRESSRKPPQTRLTACRAGCKHLPSPETPRRDPRADPREIFARCPTPCWSWLIVNESDLETCSELLSPATARSPRRSFLQRNIAGPREACRDPRGIFAAIPQCGNHQQQPTATDPPPRSDPRGIWRAAFCSASACKLPFRAEGPAARTCRKLAPRVRYAAGLRTPPFTPQNAATTIRAGFSEPKRSTKTPRQPVGQPLVAHADAGDSVQAHSRQGVRRIPGRSRAPKIAFGKLRCVVASTKRPPENSEAELHLKNRPRKIPATFCTSAKGPGEFPLTFSP